MISQNEIVRKGKMKRNTELGWERKETSKSDLNTNREVYKQTWPSVAISFSGRMPQMSDLKRLEKFRTCILII